MEGWEPDELWDSRERGERQGEKEPNTKTKHSATIWTEETNSFMKRVPAFIFVAFYAR